MDYRPLSNDLQVKSQLSRPMIHPSVIVAREPRISTGKRTLAEPYAHHVCLKCNVLSSISIDGGTKGRKMSPAS